MVSWPFFLHTSLAEHPIRWRFRKPFLYPTLLFSRDGLIWQVKRPDRHLHASFCLVASDVHWGKTEEDSRYIWWSFYFFMAVVAYIAAEPSNMHFDGFNHGFNPNNQTPPESVSPPRNFVFTVIFSTGCRVLKISTYNMFHQCFTNWSSVVGLGELVVLGCAWFGSLLNSP